MRATIQVDTRMKQTIRTRIPPSPTGQDLHVGNAYTALINYVFAQKNEGQFIIRIEDTDRTRFVEGAEENILSSLKWLGITYDEGPDIGGPHAPYRQSDRLTIYKKYAEELVEKNNAFYCFCSSERLAQMRKEQEINHQPPMYDGKCKTLTSNEVVQKLKMNDKFVIRLNVPDEGVTVVQDFLRGEVIFDNKLIDDQVLLKSDGFPTYHLGVVVDDHLMEVSHVIRGEEWISSTPKQVLLYNFFGWNLPVFVHLPIIRNPDKSKLSKRKNPVWVSWFRDEGFLPEALLNYLATLAWSIPDGRDKFSINEMIQEFDLKRIQTTAPIFNLEKLSWLNGEYIRAMSDDELVMRLVSYMKGEISETLIKKLAPLAKARMKKFSEFRMYIKPFTHFSPIALEEKYQQFIPDLKHALESISDWKSSIMEQTAKQLVDEKSWKMRDAFMALRIVVTGDTIGLPLFETFEILGKEETIKRLSSI